MKMKDTPGLYFGSKAKDLEVKIDRYVSIVEQSALMLEDAVRKYVQEKGELFEAKLAEIEEIEEEADKLRREIKHRLYSDMLIPDARGDVLALLETLDDVVDEAKDVAIHFSIEKPDIYPFVRDDFVELSETCSKAVTEVCAAVRAFFRDFYRVNEHVDKVYYWEHEADAIEERLKRATFASDEIEKFSKKVHLRFFAEQISRIADDAEAVADRLSVYAIKRQI
ncbi:MAG: DUF47 domain-containing protein [Alkalispirochaeta sp.]